MKNNITTYSILNMDSKRQTKGIRNTEKEGHKDVTTEENTICLYKMTW